MKEDFNQNIIKPSLRYLHKRILVGHERVFNCSNSSSSDCILPSQKRHPLFFIILIIIGSAVITVVI